ncbi:MAG: hypothetical protein COS68_00525 [Elusimicrobia bacterium CG06_land_8_20_14_3_00_38_11]|nr:MAG: hypothetical protein COS68_00525 [Elusimicrobia bacterium CG06_land_8_20_14_3_00_38_11]
MQISIKSVIAVALIPFAIGLLISFGKLVVSLIPLNSSEIWFLTGFVIFFAVFLVKSVPGRVYVFGHELTHAFWTILFRGKIKEFNVSSKSGSVITSKSNFLISLAPYFFPIYTFLIIFIFYILAFFLPVSKYIEWLFFFVGVSYSFHIFLNFESLSIGQSDVKKTGKVFSYIVITILNIIMAVVVLKFVAPEKIIIKKYFFESWTVALKICKFVWRYLTELYNLI